MKTIGRVLLIVALGVATWLSFSDVIAYWTGWGSSRISTLDVGRLAFVREDRISLGGPGVHFQEVRYYKTPEGAEVVLFVEAGDIRRDVFLRGRHKIFHPDRVEEITTYEPFLIWSYLLKRGAVLFILSLMVLMVAGLALKLTGQGHATGLIGRAEGPSE